MNRGLLLAVILTILSTAGCMHILPAASWRLSANNVLTPPGVSGPGVMQRIVQTDARRHGTCPSSVRASNKHVKIAVTREGLSKQAPGWLTSWAEDLEAEGCIADGEALPLARQIAQSVPLDINTAFRLLYPNDAKTVQLNPGVRLQIMTPIIRDGVASDSPIIEVETPPGTSNCDVQSEPCALNLNARFTDNLLGYEMALYTVQPKSHSPGVSVVPVSADQQINGTTHHGSRPIYDYFEPLNGARFYEAFYKAGQNEFTALLVGGFSRADLERRTRLLETGSAACETLNNEMCVAVPKRVAVNPMVVVTLNGTETTLNWGATVSAAIRAGGEQQPNVILPRLLIQKPYGNRIAPLEFDPASTVILNMILMGGEYLSWR